jgi:hypothetical protein
MVISHGPPSLMPFDVYQWKEGTSGEPCWAVFNSCCSSHSPWGRVRWIALCGYGEEPLHSEALQLGYKKLTHPGSVHNCSCVASLLTPTSSASSCACISVQSVFFSVQEAPLMVREFLTHYCHLYTHLTTVKTLHTQSILKSLVGFFSGMLIVLGTGE